MGVHAGSVRAGDDSADVWVAWVHEHADSTTQLAAVLSSSERSRMAAYRNVDAAARYVITRSLVRGVLSERLGIAPAEVNIRVTDLGKPVVAGNLHFNVSHSGDLITVAVCRERAVGIDIERRRDVQRAGALISRWLTPTEQHEVKSLHAAGFRESDAFLRVWSAKEARLKALGVGISGSNGAEVSQVVAVALDDLLSSAIVNAEEYVGAVAFA